MSGYSKIKQWDMFERDVKGLEDDEELLFQLGKRFYVIHPATKEDLENHEKDGYKCES